MIKIKLEKYKIHNYYIDVIKDKMAAETCKTNLSPQLMFKQSFTGITLKTFVGNWTKNGFWISKFRMQLMQLRPDIIAKFRFIDISEYSELSIRYSIGFSSLFIGLMWITMFALPFLAFGLVGYLIGLAVTIGGYVLLSIIELGNLQEKILEKVLSNVARESIET
ncbi:MAG: hypothetical protein IPM71_16525 [Bacteroidota bacterium]|nr:MAG: hypothetical protein IPM71_16020 [Bacteroidota bacterium]QQS51137.1 MAG: hypothetical protein IPM71_16525 [Bacteroidota bacterium]